MSLALGPGTEPAWLPLGGRVLAEHEMAASPLTDTSYLITLSPSLGATRGCADPGTPPKPQPWEASSA